MINKLQLDDFELSYSTEGEGRDVLFLHGFPSNMYFWNDIKNKLKNYCKVTVVEQRGYPLSSVENSIVSDFNIENLSLDIEKLINTLQLNNNLTIVGHDWGSIVAWSVSSRGNVKIEKLVSICGGTEFPGTSVYDNWLNVEWNMKRCGPEVPSSNPHLHLSPGTLREPHPRCTLKIQSALPS